MLEAALPYHVLIVEDEYLIATDLVHALEAEGLTALGPVAGAAGAFAILDEGGVDFAIVDINLGRAISFSVAAELRKRAIPFLFLTGYDISVVPPEFSDVPLLQKPAEGEVIVARIKRSRDEAVSASR